MRSPQVYGEGILQPLIVRPIPASGTVDMVSGLRGDATAARAVSGTVGVITGVRGDVTVNPQEPDMALDLVGPLLQKALVCANAALTTPVGRSAFYPGSEVAYDDCCDGQLWVRLISLVPSGAPANAANRNLPCGVLQWTATIGIGVIRCTPTPDNQGNAPTPASLTANGMQMTQDAADISEALRCCLDPQLDKLIIQRWDPVGPAGGCMGGEWTAASTVDNCGCP